MWDGVFERPEFAEKMKELQNEELQKAQQVMDSIWTWCTHPKGKSQCPWGACPDHACKKKLCLHELNHATFNKIREADKQKAKQQAESESLGEKGNNDLIGTSTTPGKSKNTSTITRQKRDNDPSSSTGSRPLKRNKRP